jgi:hypothetical protein
MVSGRTFRLEGVRRGPNTAKLAMFGRSAPGCAGCAPSAKPTLLGGAHVVMLGRARPRRRAGAQQPGGVITGQVERGPLCRVCRPNRGRGRRRGRWCMMHHFEGREGVRVYAPDPRGFREKFYCGSARFPRVRTSAQAGARSSRGCRPAAAGQQKARRARAGSSSPLLGFSPPSSRRRCP